VNFPPYLAQMKACGFDGTVSIELEFAPNPDKIVDWVTEAYRETDRLMQAQNLRS
jgi:sugar phosphate isomerase/epimerase